MKNTDLSQLVTRAHGFVKEIPGLNSFAESKTSVSANGKKSFVFV